MSDIEFEIPSQFNAGWYLIDRNIEEGRGEKVAVYCKDQQLTYREVYIASNRMGNVLKELGVEIENRVLLVMPDSPELIISMLGAMRIGAIPIVANTMLPSSDILYILNDSRAKAAIVHKSLLNLIEPIRKELTYLKQLIVVGEAGEGDHSYQELMQSASTELKVAETSADDSAVWQYSSGTTGRPKGIIHLHRNIVKHYFAFAKGVLGITENDTTFSVAKLFFGYGQGNGFYWAFCAGASTVLLPDRPEPVTVLETVQKFKPTLYFGVPTSYNAILQIPDVEKKYDFSSVRLCVSAGEALPAAVYQRWLDTFNVEIIDGLGSTECFHIFISNRPGKIVPGSSGTPLPGYEAKVVDEDGNQSPPGEIGKLMVKGGSFAARYWNKHELSRKTFVGEWVNTGDSYYMDDKGLFWYSGRGDDMIKAGGIWVSPIEVEGTLLTHPAVLECGVVGGQDQDGLYKPKAFIVLKEGFSPSEDLTKELQLHVKNKIAPYKYPRWVEFIDELPKTATGKIQRFKLRQG